MEATMNMFGLQVTEKKKTFTSLALVPILMLSMFACSFQTWVTKANQILVAAEPAIQIVISLLPLLGANVPPVVATEIQNWAPQVEGDLTTLTGLITQWNDAAENAKAGIVAKIEAEITVVQNQLTSILPALHILNAATQAKIAAIVAAVGEAVSLVANLVASVKGSSVSLARKAAAKAPFKNAKGFKSYCNTIVHAATGDPVVDAATAQVQIY